MSHKLFLADDSITIQRVIELTFSGEDVQVISVSDGEQAITRIPAEQPDIVLADIGMPKRSGYDVAAFVKGHPDLKHIPVLLLAGAFEPVDDARAKEVGCDGVLVKPFEPQQVIARVRALLDGPKAPAAAAPPRTLEFPRRDEPKPIAEPVPDVMPDPEPIEAYERLARSIEEPLASAMAPDESLDDYFDRLDAAFATLEIASISNPPDSARDEVPGDDGMTIPTLDELLGSGFDGPAPPLDLPLNPEPVAPRPHMPSSESAVRGASPSGSPGEPERFAPRTDTLVPAEQPAARSVIAAMLLAVEQDEPGARPVRLTTASSPPLVTDAMIDEVTRRVLERLAPGAVRAAIAEIVSDVSERLVREEIERIRSKQ